MAPPPRVFRHSRGLAAPLPLPHSVRLRVHSGGLAAPFISRTPEVTAPTFSRRPPFPPLASASPHGGLAFPPRQWPWRGLSCCPSSRPMCTPVALPPRFLTCPMATPSACLCYPPSPPWSSRLPPSTRPNPLRGSLQRPRSSLYFPHSRGYCSHIFPPASISPPCLCLAPWWPGVPASSVAVERSFLLSLQPAHVHTCSPPAPISYMPHGDTISVSLLPPFSPLVIPSASVYSA